MRIVDDVQVFAGRVRVPSALVVALALSACQTVVVRSHRDPSVGKLTFARSLAIVNFSGYENSEPIRRAGEMELVNAEGFDGLVLLWVKEARIERGGVSVALPEGFSLAEGGWAIVRAVVRQLRSDRLVD